MPENEIITNVERLLTALRMRKKGEGMPGVVRLVTAPDVINAAENRENMLRWQQSRGGVKVDYVEEIPGEEDLEHLLDSWPAPEGLALIKGAGLIGWSNDAASLTGLIKEDKATNQAAQPSLPLTQKIVIITGAGRGVGAAIAQEFVRDGSNVVIAEIDEETGRKQAGKLSELCEANEVIAVRCDVTRPEDTQALVRETVRYFGGIDIVVSNAGVLIAGGLDSLDPDDFDKVTDVNYKGFFLLTQAVTPVLQQQESFRKGYMTDIIQVNSKSGLQGSRRNFAYAGSKFGGIGLVQSFALELVQYHIKVNAVCPGNFFDLPLWSDPEKGLFVQYLKEGKVPGAATIDDVRKHYESLVPMQRGCRTEDLYRAIRYLIRQEYETGQALPVTGGQVMLG